MVLYFVGDPGYSEVIAVSDDEKKLEDKMDEVCKERDFILECYHGTFNFRKEIPGWHTVYGTFYIEKAEVI